MEGEQGRDSGGGIAGSSGRIAHERRLGMMSNMISMIAIMIAVSSGNESESQQEKVEPVWINWGFCGMSIL